MKYKQNPFPFLEKSVFCQIFGEKISILPNFEGKKSVYTEKISMSGRSGSGSNPWLFLDTVCIHLGIQLSISAFQSKLQTGIDAEKVLSDK